MTWNLIDSFSSNYEASISRSHHNRTFKANGRYWLFYGDVDTGLFGFVSSVDGETWASFTSLGSISPDNIDVFYDSANNKICYAYLGDPMYYRQGTANANGTITWDSAEVSVGEAGYTAISLVKDSAGYPWIAFGTNVRVIKATATDGSTWGSSIELWDDGGSIPKIVPLTNGKLLCISILASASVTPKSRLYDGVDTWAVSVNFAIPIQVADMFDAVAISDDVYFAVQGLDAGGLYFYKYTYGVGWGSQETISTLCKSYVNTCKICKMGTDHVRVLYAVDFWKIYSRDRTSGSWGTPTILSKIDDGWENQSPSDCSSEWYMVIQNGRGKLYWADAARPTPDTPSTLTGKLFALGLQRIFRLDQASLAEEKTFDASSFADYIYRAAYDGTYLWIVELYTGLVFQIDPTGDMSLIQVHSLDGYFDIYSIVESGDYLYLSVYEIDAEEYRLVRLTKSDGTVTFLVPPDIGSDACSAGSYIGIDASYVYFCGGVGSPVKQAIWKVNKSSFTVEDSESYSSHPSRYYEDYQDPNYYYGENPSDHIVIDHHNYLAFKGYMNETLYWNRFARNTNPQPNFTHKFKTSIQGISGGVGVDLYAFVWAYANVSTDMKTIHDDEAHTSSALALQAGKDASGALYFKLREEYGDGGTTTTYFSDSFAPTIQVDYYVKIVKTSVEEVVTLTAYFYSDPGYSILVDTISLTLHSSSVYPGFTIYYTCNVWNDSSTTGYLDLWVENSDLSGAVEDPDLPETPISSREIMILYVDSVYIYAVTAGGMVLKILKSDLSLTSEAEVIPGMGPCFNWEYSHEPVGKLFFSSPWNDIYWATKCVSKHVVMKIRCGVWNIEKLCIDPADTYLARSSDGMGSYFYFGTDSSTIKKVAISNMTIDSSLVLSVEIGVIYDICCTALA